MASEPRAWNAVAEEMRQRIRIRVALLLRANTLISHEVVAREVFEQLERRARSDGGVQPRDWVAHARVLVRKRIEEIKLEHRDLTEGLEGLGAATRSVSGAVDVAIGILERCLGKAPAQAFFSGLATRDGVRDPMGILADATASNPQDARRRWVGCLREIVTHFETVGLR